MENFVGCVGQKRIGSFGKYVNKIWRLKADVVVRDVWLKYTLYVLYVNVSIAVAIPCAVYIESRFMPQSTEIDREIIKCIIELNLYAFFS